MLNIRPGAVESEQASGGALAMDLQVSRSAEAGRTEQERREAQPAAEGAGPLLQRDYVLVLAESPTGPEEAVRLIRLRFPDYSPRALAEFTRPLGAVGLLSP